MAPPYYGYSELSGEDKAEDSQHQQPETLTSPPAPKWRKHILLLGVPFLLVLAFLAFAAAQDATVRETETPEKAGQYPEWLRDHEIRAAGDQYLLGVGKADITGCVSRVFERLFVDVKLI